MGIVISIPFIASGEKKSANDLISDYSLINIKFYCPSYLMCDKLSWLPSEVWTHYQKSLESINLNHAHNEFTMAKAS